MPFAGYDDFDDCVSKNRDKKDPEGYCAEVMRRTEGKKRFKLTFLGIPQPKWAPEAKNPHDLDFSLVFTADSLEEAEAFAREATRDSKAFRRYTVEEVA